MKNKDDNIHKNEVYQQFQHSKKNHTNFNWISDLAKSRESFKDMKRKIFRKKKTAHTDLTDGRADLTYRSSV